MWPPKSNVGCARWQFAHFLQVPETSEAMPASTTGEPVGQSGGLHAPFRAARLPRFSKRACIARRSPYTPPNKHSACRLSLPSSSSVCLFYSAPRDSCRRAFASFCENVADVAGTRSGRRGSGPLFASPFDAGPFEPPPLLIRRQRVRRVHARVVHAMFLGLFGPLRRRCREISIASRFPLRAAGMAVYMGIIVKGVRLAVDVRDGKDLDREACGENSSNHSPCLRTNKK